MPNKKSPRTTCLVLTSLALLACGIFSAPVTTPAPIQPTDTPAPPTDTPTQLPPPATLPPTATLPPRPTIASTPAPEWVTDFAEPILTHIASRPPDMEDNFMTKTGGWSWETDVFGAWRKNIQDGEALLINAAISNKQISFHDFAAEVEIRYVSGQGQGVVGIGNGSQIGYNLYIQSNSASILRGTGEGKERSLMYEGDFQRTPKVHVRVIVKGSRIAFFVNQQPFGYFEDETYRLYRGASPLLFLQANGYRIDGDNTKYAFSNFKVWDITKLKAP
jgi:hypothetical protein